MSEEKHCSKCGKPVPGESPRGICPACLMEQAMASRTIVTGQPDAELPSPPSLEEIAEKFPQYEVVECLGRGGMGVVYKARQKSLDRWVAIKVLAPERVHEERFAEHFEREAKTLAKMSHPNIVTVFDHGETGGLFYIVMEFVDGVNLRDLLREGKMEPEQALVIVPPICDALQYAHDKGIVHRDIKPENILLDRDGRVKIADFGIASLVGASGENSGTPPYMAPEQSGGTVDRRADIYALGVVLYEMLTGERPAKELVAPSRKVQLDVKIDEIVLRALEKEPERRYQTAGEFRTMVETMAATPSEPKRDETRFAGEKRQEGRGRVLLAQVETWVARYGWLSVIAIGLGLLITLGAIANFNFTLGVGKAPMMMVGSIFVAGGIIGAAIGSGRNRSGEAADSAYGDQEDFRKQNKRPRPSAMSAANPRFSRPAMVGAVWATLAFLGLLFVVGGVMVYGRSWSRVFPGLLLAPVMVLAPVGVTVLGWVAISQIRRSCGTIHGLGLAVCDGLLFPLLLLTGLIGWFWHWVFYDLILATLIAGESELSSLERTFVNNATAFTVLATLLTSLVVSLRIIRKVWRAVSPSRHGREGDTKPVQTSSIRLANLALAFSILGALIPVGFLWAVSPEKFEHNVIRGWIVTGATLSILVAAIGLGWSTRRLARGKAALIAASLSLLIAGASIIAGLQRPIQFDTPIIVKSPDGSMSGMGMTLHSMRVFDSDRVTYRLLVEGANGGETWMSEVPLELEGGLARPLNDLSFEMRGKIDWSEDGETVSFRVGDTRIAVFDINATRWKTDGLLGDDFPAASVVPPVGGEPPYPPEARTASHYRKVSAIKESEPGRYRLEWENGITFEVVGLLRNPRESTSWFRPDGTPFEKPVARVVGAEGSKPVESGTHMVHADDEIVVLCRRAANGEVQVEQLERRWIPNPLLLLSGAHIDPKKDSDSIVHFALRDTQRSLDHLDLEVGIVCSDARWETMAIYDGQRTKEVHGGSMVVFSPPRYERESGRHVIDVMHNIPTEKHALRVTARMHDGRILITDFHSGVVSGTPTKGYVTIFDHDFDIRKVKEYVLERAERLGGRIPRIVLPPSELANSIPEKVEVAASTALLKIKQPDGSEEVGSLRAEGIDLLQEVLSREPDHVRPADRGAPLVPPILLEWQGNKYAVQSDMIVLIGARDWTMWLSPGIDEKLIEHSDVRVIRGTVVGGSSNIRYHSISKIISGAVGFLLLTVLGFLTHRRLNPDLRLEKTALFLCVAGVILPLLILIGHLFGIEQAVVATVAYVLFAVMQLAALILGIIRFSEPLGRAAAITSGVMLLGSILFLS